MIDIKEAEARIAMAEFEARRLEKRARERARRWRLIAAFFQVLLLFGGAVYFQVSHEPISGAQACGLFMVIMASGAWQEYELHEKVCALEAQVAALKAALEDKTA
jgi:hypothetical protein